MSITGCATTGATFKSGVGDAYLTRAPWVAGRTVHTDGGSLLVLPISFQAAPTEPLLFRTPTSKGSSQDGALQQLLSDVQELVDTRSRGVRTSPFAGKDFVAPDVMFGCIMDAAQMECDPSRQTGLLGGSTSQHRLAVGRPSSQWISELQERLASTGAAYALVTTIEVGQYLPRQRGIRGTKYVELGRSHEVELPWLTSLETPVSALQLTAAIVDRHGLAVRIAAEGLLAKRTPIVLSAFNMQAVLQDKDIHALRTAVREDLEGHPRVLEVAVSNLLESLGLAPSPSVATRGNQSP